MTITDKTSAIAVECNADPGADPAAVTVLCDALTGLLVGRFPGRAVTRAPAPAPAPVVRMRVLSAGPGGATLSLGWETPDGATAMGENWTLSVSDTAARPALFTDFIGRVLGATRLPF